MEKLILIFSVFLIGKGGKTFGILLQYFSPINLFCKALLNKGNNPIF